jgi:hypothetical protein
MADKNMSGGASGASSGNGASSRGPAVLAVALAAAALALALLAMARRWQAREGLELDACADVCDGCDQCAAPPVPDPQTSRGYAGPPRQGYAGLPAPSANDAQYCGSSFRGDPAGDGACFALVHHHCVDGLQDDARVPGVVRGFKQAALSQLYSAAQGWTHTSGGRTKRVFNNVPRRWTSVCAARPQTAGSGRCAHVTPYEWRMSAFGHNDASRQGECGAGLFVKSKFRGSKITAQLAKDRRA